MFPLHFSSINDFLSLVNLGECTIKGCLEAYSCKHTVADKRLSFSLEHEIIDYLGKSSDTDSCLPVDYLCNKSSAVRAHQFFFEEGLDSFKQTFDSYTFEVSKWAENNEGSLFENLCKALDEKAEASTIWWQRVFSLMAYVQRKMEKYLMTWISEVD
ncbi:hypothetical protein RJ641_003385, partial [Dillenia turbinata]